MRKDGYRIAVLFLSVTAPIYCLLSAFGIQVCKNMLYLYIAAFSVGSFFLFQMKQKKLRKEMTYGIGFLLFTAALLGHTFLWCSFEEILAQVFLSNVGEYAIGGGLAAVYLALLFCLWQGAWLIRRKSPVALVFPGILGVFPVLCGYLPSVFPVILLLMFFMMYLAMPVAGDTAENAYVPIGTAFALLSVSVLLLLVIPQKSYRQGKLFTVLRTTITELFVNEPELEEVTVPEKQEEVARGGISGGKIGLYDGIIYNDQKMLTVSCGMTGSLYLKGFTGAVYGDNAWRDLSEEEYGASADFFNSLREKNTDVMLESFTLLSMIDQKEELHKVLVEDTQNYLEQVIRREYTVDYAGADSKYCYRPYASFYTVRDRSSYDGTLFNKKMSHSSSQYTVENMDYAAVTEFVDTYQGENRQLLEYIAWEKEYRSFVHEAYTRVEQAEKEILDKVQAAPGYSGTLEEYITSLQLYFQENYTYSAMPGKVPEGNDFLDYFLNETQTGYCTYFATAAVMMFRNAGIPSRYVEGYMVNISEESARNTEIVTGTRNSGNYYAADTYTMYTVDVMDRAAHAWPEIYIDGYGWIPIEVTPGYEQTEMQAGDTTYDRIVSADEQEAATADAADTTESETVLQPKEEYDTLKAYLSQNQSGKLDFTVLFSLLWLDFLRLLHLLCKIAVLLLAAAFCFWLPAHRAQKRNAWIMTKHENQTPQQDMEQIMAIYAYFEKLCRFLGIGRTEEMTYGGFAQKAMQKKDYLKEADLDKIIRSVQKIAFGRGNIGKREMQEALEAISYIHEQSYRELSKVKRILYIYIWHLR